MTEENENFSFGAHAKAGSFDEHINKSIRGYDNMIDEFNFEVVDGALPVEEQQSIVRGIVKKSGMNVYDKGKYNAIIGARVKAPMTEPKLNEPTAPVITTFCQTL